MVLQPMASGVPLAPPSRSAGDYEISMLTISDGFDGEYCWMQPRAAILPRPGEHPPAIVLTMQKLLLRESDSYLPVQSQTSVDGGLHWSPLLEQRDTLGRTARSDGLTEGVSDLTPKWHAASGQIIGIGQTVQYTAANRIVLDRRRTPVYTVYDPATGMWAHWAPLRLPDEPCYAYSMAGSVQRVDLPNGDILLPINSSFLGAIHFTTRVWRCRLQNGDLRCVESGNEMTVHQGRGLYEPSLVYHTGRFFLTLRSDQDGYHAESTDGLHFGEPKPWTFDDGKPLGSDNTQTHWVRHSNALYLAYTRRGAANDHVFRHRAPLFMARVDTDQIVVLRATERILIPNQGAQLGNFGVVDIDANETWVTTSEGMAPGHPEKYGSNGRVLAARIRWSQANLEWDKY